MNSDDLYLKDPKAKTLGGFIEAINIFARHKSLGLKESYFFNAKHDILYAGIDNDELPEDSEDGIKLVMLGWHVDSDIEGSWSYFT